MYCCSCLSCKMLLLLVCHLVLWCTLSTSVNLCGGRIQDFPHAWHHGECGASAYDGVLGAEPTSPWWGSSPWSGKAFSPFSYKRGKKLRICDSSPLCLRQSASCSHDQPEPIVLVNALSGEGHLVGSCLDLPLLLKLLHLHYLKCSLTNCPFFSSLGRNFWLFQTTVTKHQTALLPFSILFVNITHHNIMYGMYTNCVCHR